MTINTIRSQLLLQNTHLSLFLVDFFPCLFMMRATGIPTAAIDKAMMKITATTPPIIAGIVLSVVVVVLSVVVVVLSVVVVVLSVVVVVLSVVVVVLSVVVVVLSVVGEHSPSLRDEIATEHLESTVISTPVTMILAPPLTHSSIREISEPLSVSKVPSSLARYVTYVGDSGTQANDCSSMMSLVIPHSAHEAVSCTNIAVVISILLSVEFPYKLYIYVANARKIIAKVSELTIHIEQVTTSPRPI